MSNETRKLPDAPGWWWGKWDDVSLCLEVYTVNGEGGLFATRTGYPVADPRITWLAPIPGPAVCPALAEYGEAVMQRGPTQARGVSVSSALLALEDAIRAERDGAA